MKTHPIILSLTILVLVASHGAVASDSMASSYASQLRRQVVLEGVGNQSFSMAERMRHYGVSGVSVAVVEGCKVVHADGFGTATPEGKPVLPGTMFAAGSVSKVVASVGALKLVEAGTLSLDRDIDGYLHGWSLPREGAFAQSTVSLRHLLTHSAGLTVAGFKGYPVGAPLPTLQQILDGQTPANTAPVRIGVAPGTTWRYSGGGFVLTQLLMEQATRTSFAALMRDRVLLPAGLNHSTYAQPLDPESAKDAATGTLPDGAPIPGGWRVYPEGAAAGLWSTPTDLSKFAIELVRSMRGESTTLLRQDTATEMMRRQVENWGLGVEVSLDGSPRKFSHTGAPVGYRTLWLMFPDTCQGATIMTNADEGMTLAYEIARALADQYRWPDPMVSERAVAVPMTPDIATRFVGSYQLRDFPAERFEIGARPNGALVWSRQGRGHRDLVATGPDTVLSPDSAMRLAAKDRDPETGHALTVELVFSGGVNVAQRIVVEDHKAAGSPVE